MKDNLFVQPPPGVPLRKVLHYIGTIQTLEGIQKHQPEKFTVDMMENLQRIIDLEYHMLEQLMERY